MASSEIPEFVDVEIRFAAGDRGSVSGWLAYDRGKEIESSIGVMMDDISEEEELRGGVRTGTIRARIPIAQMFANPVIEGTVEADESVPE